MASIQRIFHSILIGSALVFGASAVAQSTPNLMVSQERFPYIFSNLVWWSDADLRVELKKQIPTLGDDLGRNSPLEKRVRTILLEFLKKKGINTEVQIFEPSPTDPTARRAPGAPPVSIIFSVLAPPAVIVGPITFENAPPESIDLLQSAVHSLSGRDYESNTFWYPISQMKEALYGLGYLSAQASLSPGEPVKDDERYAVPLTAAVTPGVQYHVSTIAIDGGPLLKGRDLSNYATAKPGDIAKPNPFGRLAGTLRAVYWQAGYADVAFHGDPVLDEPKSRASYQFEVIPGPLYHVRSLKIESLTPAQEAEVRSLLFKPGGIYDLMSLTSLSRKFTGPSLLNGYDFSYQPNEDKQNHFVDLVLTFYRK
jgi:outer membrane translocation and assembly module TamA